tara:strand:- start:15319 stop:15903 length:585 start_codon:yes stop_codon:yes gene_type:complete
VVKVYITLFLLFSCLAQAEIKKAVFAGGCFWCMEPPYEEQKGVKSVISGFMGGDKENPPYKLVASGKTKHLEVVQITYDSDQISYNQLLDIFWRQIDPTDAGGQFVDRGEQYSTAIFYIDDQQKQAAEASKKKMQQSGRFSKSIVTKIRPAKTFYPADEYHQDYYKKNPVRYKFYRYRSGRDQYLKKIWGKPSS